MKSLIIYKKYLPLSIHFYKPIIINKINNSVFLDYCPIFIRKYF